MSYRNYVFHCEDLEKHLEPLRRGSPPPGHHLSPELRELIHFIHRDPFDPILNVKVLKHQFRIRDNNISSRFRHAVGRTIKGYIEDLRINAACRLLESATSLNVFDIALAVGYSHPQTFYTAFRRKIGCTPGAFRERLPRRRAVEVSMSPTSCTGHRGGTASELLP